MGIGVEGDTTRTFDACIVESAVQDDILFPTCHAGYHKRKDKKVSNLLLEPMHAINRVSFCAYRCPLRAVGPFLVSTCCHV
jgi:hypothetical protein